MTAVAPLVDRFGRVARDLRISITDRCNFRCRYCMPAEGLPWMGKEEVLTYEEVRRLARVFVGLGIDSIKLTGGEPLVRRDVPRLVAMLRALGDDLDISMTTNGYLLADAAPALAAAGLDRVTVSCDSLLRHRFEEITLRDALDEVLRGLEVAAREGLGPIKVNMVVIRGVNDDEVVSFAEMARRTGYEVRFIEYMPLDAQDRWSPQGVMPAEKIVAAIERFYPLSRAIAGTEPGSSYSFADGAPGRIGVIPSVSAPFCAGCDRLRLTADGQLRACLFSLDETDLRGPVRAGASDPELESLVRACVASKWEGHRIGREDFVRPSRSMSQIGG